VGRIRFKRISREQLKRMLREGWRQYRLRDLRWSYFAVLILAVCGGVVNVLFAHGWTVWPFVFAAGILLMVHEAVDRNGQGIPPLYAYVLLGSGMTLWMLFVIVLKAVNPIVLLIGFIGLCYYAAAGYGKQLERQRLIAKRRMEGCCIHCGYPANPQHVYCDHCGEEPDPDGARIGRVLGQSRSAADKARTRASLKGEAPTASAKVKEQALLARRRTRGGKR
jgi:hypothetical protein